MGFKQNPVIDPVISKVKFRREIETFEAREAFWREKGVIRISTGFPQVRFLFCVTNTKPKAVAFGVELDFSNYDLYPPSVRFIDPFSGRRLMMREMDVQLIQMNQVVPNAPPENVNPFQRIQAQPLLMGRPEDYPFLCLPGIREYHQHPAHTGDSWFLYRGRGEGRLHWIIERLYDHSVGLNLQYQVAYSINLSPQIRIG